MSIELKAVDDIDYFQRLSLTDFSYSRIDTYDMCPSKYFFSYIKKEPRLFGEAAALGNIVHSVLEETVSNEQVLQMDQMQKSFEENQKRLDPLGQISDQLIEARKKYYSRILRP